MRLTVFLAVVGMSGFLGSCRGGGTGGANSTGASLAPAFVSTPGTAASQGTAYTYQIATSPASEPVTLAVVTAPSGATLTGNTLSWTPSAAQARVANQFSVTATNASGSVTQSWSVTPSGTITGTWVDTYWTSSGPLSVPRDLSNAPLPPRALVPQPNGSFQTVMGSGNPDGTFTIPNIPGGYYWLEPAANAYWTSSSTFDFGANVNTPAKSLTTINGNTTINLNLTGLDPLVGGDDVPFVWDSSPPFSLVSAASSPAGATSLSTGAIINSNIDFSQSAAAFLAQYEPQTLGTLSVLVLGPNATVPVLTLINGSSNTITQTLAESQPTSLDLNIKGSAWVPMFSSVGPSTATLARADLELTTQPFVTGRNVLSIFGPSIPLLGDLQPAPAPLPAVCDSSHAISPGAFISPPGEPAITTDQDFGSVQYQDPFPREWPRVFTFCQTALVSVAIPNSTTPVTFGLVDTQSSSVSSSPISPLIGQVQNPTINGMSLFVPGSVNATDLTLKWTAPNGATPTGYKITTFVAQTLPMNGVSYLPSVSFYTAKTSALLPPLQPGATYVFLISAMLDGAADFESRPNRSALPTASVSVVSAPITIQ